MRYRRLSYRYTLVLTTDAMRPLGYVEYAARPGVRFATTRWRPAADVFETAEGVFVVVELAGVDYEQLDVTVYEDAVVVEGERRLRPFLGEGVYHAAEIRQGPFRLELALPAGLDVDRVDARYEQGLLWIALAKAEGR